MKIRNLTPHPITLYRRDGSIVKITQDGLVARIEEDENYGPDIELATVMLRQFGAPVDLPEPEEGVILIVSGFVLQAVPDRADVFGPGRLIRDEGGNLLGCDGLYCTPAYIKWHGDIELANYKCPPHILISSGKYCEKCGVSIWEIEDDDQDVMVAKSLIRQSVERDGD